MTYSNSISDNLKRTLDSISSAARKAGRNPDEVELIAVSKFVAEEAILEAYKAGQREFGENRVVESAAKIQTLRETHPDIRWHMIGHLQTNKTKKALELFDCIQSVDSLRLAREISRRAEPLNREIEILVEINSSGEKQKSGLIPEETLATIAEMSELPALNIRGLMTLGPLTENQRAIRSAFSLTKKLFEQFCAEYGKKSNIETSPPILSMGMSGDYKLAIEEGSTMVRIGSALFGPRQYK